MCDQAPTNESAINRLHQETNSQYLKIGKENRVFGFEINDKEIVPLFDVPYLWKKIFETISFDKRFEFYL